jgi:5-methylcytosine-specific restriction enzyme A
MQNRKKRRNVPLDSAAWLKLRAQVLAEEPLCRMCLAAGYTTPATDVDHINNGAGDYTDDNRRENLQPLCHECHSRKTRAEIEGAEVVEVWGFDRNGFPRDPGHHWNLTGGDGER